jgi:cytochrome c oxidase cbb3-type subunit 3
MVTATDSELDRGDAAEGEGEREPRVLPHAIDDIREYDNPLPGWWRATIVFAFAYVIYYDVGRWGTPIEARYRAQLADYDRHKIDRDRAEAEAVNEDVLARASRDGATIAVGAKVFAQRCVPCHGDRAQGVIGPNLTDDFQIHGRSRMDIYKTIRNGATGTPMLAWGEQLTATDVMAVAAYAITLRGTHVAGKPPQGDRVEPFK